MERMDLHPNDVVQLGPNAANPSFAHCFMLVTEALPFGAQGYVLAPGERDRPAGQLPYRARFDEMEHIGKAAFQIPS